MGRLAVVEGSSTRGLHLDLGDCVQLQRHGDEGYALPHEIDYPKNMRAVLEAGCDRVLAIGSVGGLRAELGPGTFLCPDDFIALDAPPSSALAGIEAHDVRGFDPGWRGEVLEAFTAAGTGVRDGGVYWQATGPRLETPAEIRLIAERAEVIGMTIASECVIASELGLRYAAVCVVDNLANGIGEHELEMAELEAARASNVAALDAALAAALPKLG